MAIAGMVGASDRGLALIAAMRAAIEEVRSRVAAAGNRPRIFCEEWGKPIIRSQPWVKELVEAAGGSFLGEPAKHTTAEEVRAADPEVFCAAWCGAGDRVPLQKIIREREWDQISAVRSGRVFCISTRFSTPPRPLFWEDCAPWPGHFIPSCFPSPPEFADCRADARHRLCLGRGGAPPRPPIGGSQTRPYKRQPMPYVCPILANVGLFSQQINLHASTASASK